MNDKTIQQLHAEEQTIAWLAAVRDGFRRRMIEMELSHQQRLFILEQRERDLLLGWCLLLFFGVVQLVLILLE